MREVLVRCMAEQSGTTQIYWRARAVCVFVRGNVWACVIECVSVLPV